MSKEFSELKKVLIERDGITPEQADAQINEAREAMQEYLADEDHESAENICEEFFGLEPDYIIDLM